MKRTTKIILTGAGCVLVIAGLSGTWYWQKRGAVMKDIALDIKAGIGARHAARPFDRFLELRYGPLNEATNRQKAFTGFFDPAHIQGMRTLVSHMRSEDERKMNINATAQWIGNYRTNMSPDEKQALVGWLQSEEGKKNIQKASVLYRSHDITYRAATESVIRELMVTLATLHQEGAAK